VEKALERVGMAHRMKHYPHSFPAASSSVLPSREPSQAIRQSCSLTSRRQPRLGQRRTGDGTAPGTAQERINDLHGDARQSLCAARQREIHLFDGSCKNQSAPHSSAPAGHPLTLV